MGQGEMSEASTQRKIRVIIKVHIFLVDDRKYTREDGRGGGNHCC